MSNQQITQVLEEMKKDIKSIKENMVDKDMILSSDDLQALEETAKAKRTGSLISLEEIEKELGC